MTESDDPARVGGSRPPPGQSDDPKRSVLSAAGSEFIASGFSPEWTVSPGEILQDELDARNITQAELALRANLTAKHINQIIKGVASLSSDTALRLERALGTPSHFWNILEATFQDRRARDKMRESLAVHASWLRRFPTPVLIARGIFAKGDDEVTRIEKLLAFFQVANPDAYDKVWTEPVAAGFRRSQHSDVDPYATAVWLRLGERSAENRSCDTYDPNGLAELLPALRGVTLLPDQLAFRKVQQECAGVGVAVEFEHEVKGSRANGAARWLNATRAMILLSGRYRYHDIFWFSFFHEAAHLLLHPRRKTVIDLDNAGDDADGQESAANQFAATTLVPPHYAARLGEHTTAEGVIEIAREIGVHPGIVAGQLAHQYSTWSRFAKLRRSLKILDGS